MAKLMFLLLLVLMTIFLFAGSGNQQQRKPNTIEVPATNTLAAPENLIASSTPAPAIEENTQPAASAVADIPKHKLKLVPKDDNAELWIMSDGDNGIGSAVQEIQIYNSSGERVFYTRLHSAVQKVNLCNYKGGKYVVKIGDEVFNLMII
jgi:hypothetical protein